MHNDFAPRQKIMIFYRFKDSMRKSMGRNWKTYRRLNDNHKLMMDIFHESLPQEMCLLFVADYKF